VRIYYNGIEHGFDEMKKPDKNEDGVLFILVILTIEMQKKS
jgi:hypothetical protein